MNVLKPEPLNAAAVVGTAVVNAIVDPYFLPMRPPYMPENNWTTGLCQCTDDTKSCFEICFCGYCQIGYQDRKMTLGQTGPDWGICLAYCCLDMFVSFGLAYSYGAWQIRDRIKTRFNIEPQECCKSVCIAFFCASCSLCQTYRELSNRGYWPGGMCCISVAPPTTHPMGAPVVLGMGTSGTLGV